MNLKLFLVLFVLYCAFLRDVESGANKHWKPPMVARPIPNYRIVNWCITGRDEPELHMWPFNQFIPMLRRHNRFHKSKRYKYELSFFEISTTQDDIGVNGTLLKTVHVIFKAFERKTYKTEFNEIWEPFPIEGLIIQANHNPGALGFPTGQFFVPLRPRNRETDKIKDDKQKEDEMKGSEIRCLDCNENYFGRPIACRKRTIFSIEHPTVLAFHHLMPKDSFQLEINSVPQEKQAEVHANFRWYSSPCTETTRLEFHILVVRSFLFNEYDVIRKGPYEVRVRDQTYQSDFVPSPYFTYFTHRSFCHVRSSADIQLEKDPNFLNFEMSSKFGCCTRYEQNPKSAETMEQVTEERSFKCQDITKKNPIPKEIPKGNETYFCYFPYPLKKCTRSSPMERADTPFLACKPCKDPISTTIPISTEPPWTLFKRSAHGGMMIMTNFCLQPLVMYVARFYKETFNEKSCKGQKVWYWIHVLGGCVSCTLIYFGLFSGEYTKRQEEQLHVALGHIYVSTLVVCYLTSWGRHKNSYINQAAEFVHGSLGYVTIGLAIACVESAKSMEFTAKLLVYLMIGCQGLFMIVMTVHICVLDKKFGMRPRRRHFPTIEARFDEVRVPQGLFRIILLVMLACLTFGLSFASLFYP